jgi:hypothetical protein
MGMVLPLHHPRRFLPLFVALRAFALACQGELKEALLAAQVKVLTIEKLRSQIAEMCRMQFGRSSSAAPSSTVVA